MQLVAYGAQDIYLTGNPQITFFKVVYRRHTNFSMEAIEQTFNGTPAHSGTSTATISRNGDLVHRMYVEMDPSLVFNDSQSSLHVPSPALTLLSTVELEIGGQRIDRYTNHWAGVWADLTENTQCCITAADGFLRTSDLCAAEGAELFKAPNKFERMTLHAKGSTQTGSLTNETYAAVPLLFWFCKNPGLALPLIALQYHEVKVKITWCAATEVAQLAAGGAANNDAGLFGSVKLWADYIYLDTDERRRFAQVSHEYLIEQLQYQTEPANNSKKSFTLNFNHPVKELIWSGQRTSGFGVHRGPASPVDLYGNGNNRMRKSSGTAGGEWQLKLNGHDRFAKRHYNYFARTQVHEHHPNAGVGITCADAICVYSFALKPEEHQPSGTCNFSRIDNAQLNCDQVVNTQGGAGTDSHNLIIYAVNYNVLRIMSGMGGLAYSN